MNAITWPERKAAKYTSSGGALIAKVKRVRTPAVLVLSAMLAGSSALASPVQTVKPKPQPAKSKYKPKAPAKAAKPAAPDCPGIQVGPDRGPPFGAGEELAYDLSVAGLYIGRMEMKVGKPRTVNGRPALALFVRARTSGFTSTLKSFAGRYMVLSDPDNLRPIALRSEATYGEDPRTEHARFRTASHVDAQFLHEKKNGKRNYEREAPLFDIVSLLYYARMIPLKPGTKLCQEVYADKRLWRMEAEVVGKTRVGTPAGDKDALSVKTRWVRMPHPDFDPRRKAPHVEVDLFFSNDATRVPLSFVARAKEATAKGELVRWSTAQGDGEISWDF